MPSQLKLMCMERRFSQAMASEWQTAFVVSHKMPRSALLTAVKNYNKILEKLQDFSSRPRPRPRPRLSFLSSRRLETKTLVSRTTSLVTTVSSDRVLLFRVRWYFCNQQFYRADRVIGPTPNS